MSAPDRRARLDRGHLEAVDPAAVHAVERGALGVYRQPRPANDDDLAMMRRIDELFTAWPFLGSRRMAVMLRAEGLFDQPQARAAADAEDGDCGAGTEAADDASRRRATRSSPTCCGTWRSTGRTRSGRPTSPIFRSGGASSIS